MGMPRSFVLSLAGLLLFAGVFGFMLGVRAIPPGETEIINAVAADYVTETGGSAQGCYAVPSALEGVRMLVICGDDWARAVGRYGETVELDPSDLSGGPRT
jgi:ABC-type xylose transport system permease subunit